METLSCALPRNVCTHPMALKGFQRMTSGPDGRIRRHLALCIAAGTASAGVRGLRQRHSTHAGVAIAQVAAHHQELHHRRRQVTHCALTSSCLSQRPNFCTSRCECLAFNIVTDHGSQNQCLPSHIPAISIKSTCQPCCTDFRSGRDRVAICRQARQQAHNSFEADDSGALGPQRFTDQLTTYALFGQWLSVSPD